MKNNNCDVTIETFKKTYKITCNNIMESKKLIEEIIKFKTGSTFIERTSAKVIKFTKEVAKTATTIGGTVASVGVVATTINKNKKEIIKAAKTIKELLKK